MTWNEQLECLCLAQSRVRDAREALEALEGSGELSGLLEAAEANLGRYANELHGRIEARESREERAMEREYRREVV